MKNAILRFKNIRGEAVADQEVLEALQAGGLFVAPKSDLSQT